MQIRRFRRILRLRSGKGVCNVKLRMESVELRKISFLDATPQLYTLNSTFSILPARGEERGRAVDSEGGDISLPKLERGWESRGYASSLAWEIMV